MARISTSGLRGNRAQARTVSARGASSDLYLRGMERLVQVIQELSLARTLEQVMAIARGAARELTGADGATFVLRERDLCYYADEDAIEPLWTGRRFPMSACISGWAMLHREPVVIPDIYADPRIPVDAYRPTFVKSLVVVPIRTTEPIGAIGNYWAKRHRASHEQLHLLQALAHSTSVALENVDLYRSLERRVAERTNELHTANSELAAANESLRELQRQKTELAALLAHDLRSPAATIAMRAQMRLDSPNLSDRERREWSQQLAASEAIMRMATNLLDVTRAETGSLTIEPAPIELGETVRRVAEIMSAFAEGRGQTIAVDLPDSAIELTADPELLRRVLQNLVDNSLRYSPEDSALRIVVAADETSVEIAVRDAGPGIPAELREHVFERYVRLSGAAASEMGRGLGLAFCRLAIEAHGGRIWAEANEPKGTCFRVRLPRRAAEAPASH